MMKIDELLALVAECASKDALPILQKLAERVDWDTLREAYLSVTQSQTDLGDLPQFYQVAEFLRVVGDPPPMLVEGLLPENSLVLVTGKPKAGKSFLAIDIMDNICQGTPVFGAYQVNRPGPVCYIGMEDGQYEIANRMMGRGIRNADDGKPLYVCATRFKLSDADNMAFLERMIATIKPVLLVVDTAREALGIRDWNAAAEVSDAIRPIREFARRFCTVVLVAHNRKGSAEDAGDEISGSNALSSSVDGWISAWKVEKRDDGNRRLHLAVVGRGGMRGECIAEMNTRTTHFHALSDDEVNGEAAAQEIAARKARWAPYIEALESLPNQTGTITDIALKMNRERKTVDRIVKEMVAAGEAIVSDMTKVDGAGRPAAMYERSKF